MSGHSQEEDAHENRASRFENISTLKKVLISTIAPLLLLIALGGLALFSINKLIYTSKWVDHTHVVLGEAAGIIAAAVDMETGMRGYLLAGEETFLEPYNSGEAAAYPAFASLRQTVSDNPPQVQRLHDAEEVLREWQANVTEPQIALRREIGRAPSMNDVAARVAEARGKTFFDKFRGQIAKFISTERKLLAEREKDLAEKLGGGETQVAAEHVIESQDWVKHTYEVILKANALLAAAIDMETGMRGYLLSGVDAFLEPLESGRAVFGAGVLELQQIVSDNPPQVELLGEIKTTIDAWNQEVVDPMIELRGSIVGAKTMDDIRDIVAEARGKQYFDKFRAIMAAFSAEEEALIITRQAANESTASNTFMLIIGGVVAGLAIGLGAAWAIGASIAKPIQRMTASMHALADGHLDVDVLGRARRDEVGDMARATVVFQQNAIEKATLDAELQKAAAEKAAMQEDVKLAVAHASDGDFSKRMAARYEDDSLNAFADLVNKLLENVARGVRETERVMGTLARGDLDAKMDGQFRGAFAELQANVNDTVSKLRETVGGIVSTTTDMRRATSGISNGADDLSARAEKQAAGLEEVAATMEQMAATVKQNAENAVTANSLTSEAQERASRGGEVVGAAIKAMSQIEQGSDKITEIVSVIDGFAFQTNLLALNAAVEAARAGDAGKGFAVVASEVRSLAQRSADAARDIKALVDQSAEQVSGGVQLVTETGEVLGGIVQAIGEVSDMVSGISKASREQGAGVDEIASALSSLDEITQQNSALAEESANAARDLGGKANTLDEVVSFFTMSASARDASAIGSQAA